MKNFILLHFNNYKKTIHWRWVIILTICINICVILNHSTLIGYILTNICIFLFTILAYIEKWTEINQKKEPVIDNRLTKSEKEKLNKIYGILWTEVYHDPENEITSKFSIPLVNIMTDLNETLKFNN